MWIIVSQGHSCYRPRRDGERKRKVMYRLIFKKKKTEFTVD
jgi:ribosomal protein S6E (S10)